MLSSIHIHSVQGLSLTEKTRLENSARLTGVEDQTEDCLANGRNGTKRKKIAFGWYGGKFNHLDWLLPLLPNTHHYCEPFSGSAAVLLNRPASSSTYEDRECRLRRAFAFMRAI